MLIVFQVTFASQDQTTLFTSFDHENDEEPQTTAKEKVRLPQPVYLWQ